MANVTAPLGIGLDGFLFMFNSNSFIIGSIWVSLRDIRLQSISGLDLSKSFKVNVMIPFDSPNVWFPIDV